MSHPRRPARRDRKSRRRHRTTAGERTSRSRLRRIAPNRIVPSPLKLPRAGLTRPIRSHRPPRSRALPRPSWPRSRNAKRRPRSGRRRNQPKRNQRMPTMRRADLLAELNSEYEAWEGLLAQIGEDRMEEPGVAGSWSIKDVIAHLTAWRRRTVGRLESVARGQPEPAHEWPADLHEDDES